VESKEMSRDMAWKSVASDLKAMARMQTGEVETYLLRVWVDVFKCIESILC